MKLVTQAPGKVNLCLFVGELRDDGRHSVLTLIESVSITDELSIATKDEGADEVMCPGVEGTNIVASALEGLRAGGWDAPPLRVEIVKRVPVAAGMGGGSSDAAAMLRIAERIAPISAEKLSALAARLGADVPSQLAPGASIGTGAGEQVRTLAALPPHAFVIVPQEDQLSTARVYGELDRLGTLRSAEELERLEGRLHAAVGASGRLPSELLANDLERAAVSLCPQIAAVLDSLRAAGADEAMVSGSGPTAFGLFWGNGCERRAQETAESLGFPATCAVPWGLATDIHAVRHNSRRTDD